MRSSARSAIMQAAARSGGGGRRRPTSPSCAGEADVEKNPKAFEYGARPR